MGDAQEDFCWEWAQVNSTGRDFVLDHLQAIAADLALRRSRLQVTVDHAEDKVSRRAAVDQIIVLAFKLNAVKSAIAKLRELNPTPTVPRDVPE